jgi:hypothetical protein
MQWREPLGLVLRQVGHGSVRGVEVQTFRRSTGHSMHQEAPVRSRPQRGQYVSGWLPPTGLPQREQKRASSGSGASQN